MTEQIPRKRLGKIFPGIVQKLISLLGGLVQTYEKYLQRSKRAFGFIKFFQDFDKPCFKKGIIIGVVTGCIATVIISASVYLAARLCICCCGKQKFRQGSDNEITNVGATKSLPASVVIDIEMMQQKTLRDESQSLDSGREIKRVKSCILGISEGEVEKYSQRSRSLSI